MTQTKIGTLEIILWILSIVLLISTGIIESVCPCFSKHHQALFAMSYNFTVGALSALTILGLQRLDKINYLDKIYKKEIGGTYTRIFIDQYKTSAEHTQPLKDKNIGELVKLTHLGDHIIQVETKYWDKNVKGILEFSENSQFLATGTYRYLDKTLTDIGTYKVHRFADNKEALYVYYENTVPGNGAVGYEIWTKK